MTVVPEYTAAALVAVLAVVVVERRWLRTGLFRRRSYWIALAICLAFMVPVNGWLTKLSAPVFLYDPDAILGVRVPWDIPVEDYLFGWALLTLTLMRWDRARLRDRERSDPVPAR